jgi:hypothetical protein
MNADNNFLYQCSRNVALLNEFPFIKQLHVQLNYKPPKSTCCPPPKVKQSPIHHYNEVKKIIATMTQPALDRFKDILRVDSLSVTYTDELNITQHITR